VYGEILQAIRTLAIGHAAPYTTIDHGAMPAENGLAIYLGPGVTGQRHMDKGGIRDITIALNGKHGNLGTVLSALSNIHRALEMMRDYPSGEAWQILNIETATPPNYLDREQSGTRQWLCGSILAVKIYVKGECV